MDLLANLILLHHVNPLANVIFIHLHKSFLRHYFINCLKSFLDFNFVLIHRSFNTYNFICAYKSFPISNLIKRIGSTARAIYPSRLFYLFFSQDTNVYGTSGSIYLLCLSVRYSGSSEVIFWIVESFSG